MTHPAATTSTAGLNLHPFQHAGQYSYRITGEPAQVGNGAGEVVLGGSAPIRSDHRFLLAAAGRMLRVIQAVHAVPGRGMLPVLSPSGLTEVHRIGREAELAATAGQVLEQPAGGVEQLLSRQGAVLASHRFLIEQAGPMFGLILALHMVPHDGLVQGVPPGTMAEAHAIATAALAAGIDIIGASEGGE